jgi:hypothetical protein
MEGLLKKKNSQGVWKDRYCQLKNSFLMTYKPLTDKSGPSDELKETIDLKKLAKVIVTTADILEITLSTGEFYQYMGGSLDIWIDLIMRRATWAQQTSSTFKGMVSAGAEESSTQLTVVIALRLVPSLP